MSEYIVDVTGLESGDYAIAREEIVRCRDCQFYITGMYMHFTCEYLQHWVEPENFCAWGERKERIEQ